MANLKKIILENFRGFYDEPQSIEFAIPSGKPGSGITLITGANNSGKTSIIEALLWNEGKNFDQDIRHKAKHTKILIQSDNDSEVKFVSLDDGSQVKKEGEHNLKFTLIASRRVWPFESHSVHNESNLLHDSGVSNPRKQQSNDLVAFLTSINRDQNKKAKLNSLLCRVIDQFEDWTIDTNDGKNFISYRTKNGLNHNANGLGEGVISLFRICSHLIIDEFDERILIIDEPELSLHPFTQKVLSEIISESLKQIIICTHSPYFVNWKHLINGAKLIRINKNSEGHSLVSFLKDPSEYKSLIKLISEYQKPQLLDTTAKEIFTADKILFVEGQEDVGLIRNHLDARSIKPNFELFGYGVGGADNMPVFIKMANDLGLNRVAVIFDKGSDVEQKVGSLQNKYGGYTFKILPTEDIRDKHIEFCKNSDTCDCFDQNGKKNKPDAREGCFNSKGELKNSRKNEFDQIIDELHAYFS